MKCASTRQPGAIVVLGARGVDALEFAAAVGHEVGSRTADAAKEGGHFFSPLSGGGADAKENRNQVPFATPGQQANGRGGPPPARVRQAVGRHKPSESVAIDVLIEE